jgi:diguanylate cyclase (GGDEF)-like protein
MSWIRRFIARRVALYAALLAAGGATLVGVAMVAFFARDVHASLRAQLLVLAITGGAATVAIVAAGTAIVVERLLARPVRDLTRAVTFAEKGRWLARARSERVDELGELARAFDRLCETVTDLSVAVIDNDRELAWSRRELRLAEALTLLFELSQSLTAADDFETTLAAIPARVAPVIGVDEMVILLHDASRGGFVVRAGFGAGNDVLGVTFPDDDPICGAVARTGEPLRIDDTAHDPRYTNFQGKHVSAGAFVCVPMRAPGKSRLVGVFSVLRRNPAEGTAAEFGDGDVRLLTSLASYTALALVHAEATQRIRDLADTDELTGLANRRHLMSETAREVVRADRTGEPLSALMIDLDHFKRINDERGHLVGDIVLRAVAQALAATVRKTDRCARYGGEEFVVILPASPKPDAMAVAEKLRQTVADLAPEGIPVTVSIGVASLPTDATTAERLLDAADQALLLAKRAGRDRVEAAPLKAAA